jgi:hypothetical protein
MTDLATRIAHVTKMLADIEHFLQDLRNAPSEPKGTYVLGWENGLYVRAIPGGVNATNVMNASLFSQRRPRPAGAVVNGSGEHAGRVEWERALAREITRQEDLHTWLCGQYRDLLQERVDAQVSVEGCDYAAMSTAELRAEWLAGDERAWDAFVARFGMPVEEVVADA